MVSHICKNSFSRRTTWKFWIWSKILTKLVTVNNDEHFHNDTTKLNPSLPWRWTKWSWPLLHVMFARSYTTFAAQYVHFVTNNSWQGSPNYKVDKLYHRAQLRHELRNPSTNKLFLCSRQYTASNWTERHKHLKMIVCGPQAIPTIIIMLFQNFKSGWQNLINVRFRQCSRQFLPQFELWQNLEGKSQQPKQPKFDSFLNDDKTPMKT